MASPIKMRSTLKEATTTHHSTTERYTSIVIFADNDLIDPLKSIITDKTTQAARRSLEFWMKLICKVGLFSLRMVSQTPSNLEMGHRHVHYGSSLDLSPSMYCNFLPPFLPLRSTDAHGALSRDT